MKLTAIAFIFSIYGIAVFSCSDRSAKANRYIVIQPFGNFSPELAHQIYRQISNINHAVVLKQPIPLPKLAYYALRNRYRADSLIRYLNQMGNADTVIVGLTNWDISATKDHMADWGVMGLGYCPGNACVVSTFRLSAGSLTDQFYKVVIHELGHTQGLTHCLNKSCYMRDAEGGNVLNEEKYFCQTCRSFLKKKGWKLE